MKGLISLLQIVFFGLLASPAFLASSGSIAEKHNPAVVLNRIDGIVWDPSRNPVADVYVELQNEFFSSIARVRTNSSGRFSFTVARQGNYIVKVLASGTNFLDATESVQIVNVTQFSSDSVYLDIYLKIDKRKMTSGVTGVTDSVFVQEVPEEARKLYKNGVKIISTDFDKGSEQIEQALKIFPEYFDALNRLGQEYTQRKEYQKSLAYLIKSIDVNQRSFTSFYALAYACYQLNHRPEALRAVEAATILQPTSINAQLLYGTLLRLDGSHEKAEKVLLQTKALSKNTPLGGIHWQLALLYNKQGRNKEAVAELELYLKTQPDESNKKAIQNLIANLSKETNKKAPR